MEGRGQKLCEKKISEVYKIVVSKSLSLLITINKSCKERGHVFYDSPSLSMQRTGSEIIMYIETLFPFDYASLKKFNDI